MIYCECNKWFGNIDKNHLNLSNTFVFCPWCGEKLLYRDSTPIVEKKECVCVGMGRGGTHQCCDRAGEYNGFASGPIFFECPESCPCHD